MVKNFIEKELLQNYSSFSENRRENILKETIRRLKNQGLLTRITDKLIGALATSIGIACFSVKPDNLMMWSHYSNFHKGLCLEFTPENDRKFFGDLRKVEYTDSFQAQEININKGKAIDSLRSLFLTKATTWKDEQEMRLIEMKQGKYHFKEDSLTSVIFGIKAQSQFKNLVIKETKDIYPNLSFFQAKPISNSFSLRFHKINPAIASL